MIDILGPILGPIQVFSFGAFVGASATWFIDVQLARVRRRKRELQELERLMSPGRIMERNLHALDAAGLAFPPGRVFEPDLFKRRVPSRFAMATPYPTIRMDRSEAKHLGGTVVTRTCGEGVEAKPGDQRVVHIASVIPHLWRVDQYHDAYTSRDSRYGGLAREVPAGWRNRAIGQYENGLFESLELALAATNPPTVVEYIPAPPKETDQ